MPSPSHPPKSHLHALCRQYAQDRINACQQAIDAAQESANSETKSSAGDKYETGRAMAQNERDRNAVQLQQARQLLQDLERINPDQPCDTVRPGALVHTSLGWFYISISAGKLPGEEVFAVSAAAPVAAVLAGKRVGEEAVFNGKPVRIHSIA